MISVLLVEDNMGDARLVEESLRHSPDDEFHLHHVTRVQDAMKYLHGHKDVDVILSDMTLPDSSGSETFQLLHKAATAVPVIFMTGSGDNGLAVNAIQQGAQDYLIKGEYSSHALVRIIKYAIERKKYQDEASTAKAITKSLRHEARLLKLEQVHLVELNQAKDEFISLASHQLRTPATGVKQYLGMVLEGYAGDVPAAQKAFLTNAYASNERQLVIINDLLKVAQLDAGKVTLTKQPTNMSDMLTSIIHEQAVKFIRRQQRVIFDPVRRDIVADVDPERMRMVFENLIDNASKYTHEGRNITITLELSARAVIVTVHDEGVGVAAEDIGRMFNKFSRVANERSDLVGGSGLGLYWVKRIISLHDSTITVNSTVGKGTTFRVSIPS